MSSYRPEKTIIADKKLQFGIVVSDFNAYFTSQMLKNAEEAFKDFQANVVKVVHVPGAFEMPLTAKQLLQKNCDVVLVLGVLIKGNTDHYHYVCDAVNKGIMEVTIKNNKPVIFGLLTCNTEKQVQERVDKVADLAYAAVIMGNNSLNI